MKVEMRRTPNPPLVCATRSSVAQEWLLLAAHLEDVAPADVTADELARVEDAAAEWVFQRSLFRSLKGSADYS
jgi:hypothetical protein